MAASEEQPEGTGYSMLGKLMDTYSYIRGHTKGMDNIQR